MSRDETQNGNSFHVRCSVEINQPAERIFERWRRIEELPRLMRGLQRVKIFDGQRSLWEADLYGHQVIWEAQLVGLEEGRCIRWESRYGATNSGEVTFEELSEERMRLTVDLTCRPRGVIERVGLRLGLLRRRIRSDLAIFRDYVERR